ncbi:phosphatidylglycerophosphatase A family protein [Kordiimonas aestuarii]|uniref:phosphatidylglycerophosphatase A family protein n=1 Tax=Kordiimonas aestuarii TaxID=1005925 RepID=UPI0021D35116|nr:phosphatidylglycerophosphatase A [Kordiimonas aestuarii]
MAKVSLRTWNERNLSPHFWFVTGLGIGMLRPAPGTWGSLLGLLIGVVLIQAGFGISGLIAGAITLTVFASLSINHIEKLTNIHDAPEIIIDEIAGQWLALIPAALIPKAYIIYGLAFLLFRFFDILKPWPIGWLDKKVAGGFGVMVDDLIAGILAAISIWLLLTTGLLDGLV